MSTGWPNERRSTSRRVRVTRAGGPKLEHRERSQRGGDVDLHRHRPGDHADNVGIGEPDQGTAQGNGCELHRDSRALESDTPLSRDPRARPSTSHPRVALLPAPRLRRAGLRRRSRPEQGRACAGEGQLEQRRALRQPRPLLLPLRRGHRGNGTRVRLTARRREASSGSIAAHASAETRKANPLWAVVLANLVAPRRC